MSEADAEIAATRSAIAEGRRVIGVPPRHLERHSREHAAFNESLTGWATYVKTHDEIHAALRAWYNQHHPDAPILPIVTYEDHERAHDLIDAWLDSLPS